MINQIRDTPIIIVGQGPSADKLKKKMCLFEGKDIIWASLNRAGIIEQTILMPAGINLGIIFCSSLERISYLEEFITGTFRDILILTSYEAHPKIMGILSSTRKPNYNAIVTCSSFGYGFSSLFAMLCALGKLGARDIYLIGFDGKASGHIVYYEQRQIGHEDFEARGQSIWRDTMMMNKIFWDYWKYIGLNPFDIKIFNQSGSAIKCFPYRTIEQMAEEIQ